MEHKNTHGGARVGSGPKPSGIEKKYIQIRVTPEQHDFFRRLGGSPWIQKTLEAKMLKIDEAIAKLFPRKEYEWSGDACRHALWTLSAPANFSTLGLDADEAAVALDKVKELVSPLMDKKADECLRYLHRDYNFNDYTQRRYIILLPGAEAEVLNHVLDPEDRCGGWWGDEMVRRVIELIKKDVEEEGNTIRYVVYRDREYIYGGKHFNLMAMKLSTYCDYLCDYDERSDQQEKDDHMYFSTLEEAEACIEDLHSRGVMNDKNYAEIKAHGPYPDGAPFNCWGDYRWDTI